MSFEPDHRPLDWMKRSTIEGFVALVVGGASGIGGACARTFAANGGLVMVTDQNAAGAEATAKAIRDAGQTAAAMKLDVGQDTDIAAAVAATVERYGRLDVLINTAAMVPPGMLDGIDLAVWDAAFNVNVRGALKLALACLPHLRKSPSPAIVHVGSLAGIAGYARSGAYGPSKAALMTLSRQMALEWAVEGIRVNVVIPGTVDTPSVRVLSAEAIATRKNQIPFGRLSHASEQADVAVFLASPVASFVTGQCFVVDGGFSLNIYPQPMGMQETLREHATRTASR